MPITIQALSGVTLKQLSILAFDDVIKYLEGNSDTIPATTHLEGHTRRTLHRAA